MESCLEILHILAIIYLVITVVLRSKKYVVLYCTYEIDLSMIDWVVIELRKIVSTKIPTLLLRSTLLINDTIIKCGTFLQNFFFQTIMFRKTNFNFVNTILSGVSGKVYACQPTT